MPYSVPMNDVGDARPFQCQVCFEELSTSDTVTLEACSHACCRRCLRQHVTGSISWGQRSPGCFYPLSHTGGRPQLCPGVVSEAEIERLVDPKTLVQYRRFQFNAQHPVLGRQCPHCDHCQVFPHGEQQPDCTCEVCGTTFCFSHSLAHVGRTCAEYEDTIRQVERVTVTAIERTTKRCPECDATIEKDGGCNHMTCLNCGASFCWLCLSFVEQTAFPEHYRTLSLSGCAGLQSANDSRFMWVHRVGRLAARGLIGVVVGVPALAITAVLTVLTVGWYPIRSVYGGTVWGACKVCFYFTAVGLLQTLDQMRGDIVQGLGDLSPVFLRRS